MWAPTPSVLCEDIQNNLQSTDTPIPKPKRTRTRAGCVGCKLRKKKCDEREPVCSGCERNYLLCKWPETILGAPKARSKSANKKRRDSIDRDDIAEIEGTTSREGSANRGDHDSGWSKSRRCSPIEAEAEREMNVSLYDNMSGDISSLPPIARRLLDEPRARLFFNHYLHRTSNAISGCHRDTNPFITHIVPMAMENIMVFQSLLALSGIHYACSRSIEIDLLTWSHYGQVVKTLIVGLTKHTSVDLSPTAGDLFVVTMMLAVIESLRGDGSSAVLHVKGSRRLLLSALQLPESELDESTRAVLIELYVYMSMTSNIVMEEDWAQMLQSDLPYLLPVKTQGDTSPGMLCGIAHDLFKLIPEVFILARRRDDEEKLRGTASWQTTSACISLHSIISRWKPDSLDEYTSAGGKLYQLALLVCLQPSRGPTSHEGRNEDRTITDETFDILTPLLATLPVDAPISTTICWPLAIIGSCTPNPQYQDIIRQRLQAMYEHLALDNLRGTLRLLEHIWATKSGALSHPLKISLIMKEWKMNLIFS